MFFSMKNYDVQEKNVFKDFCVFLRFLQHLNNFPYHLKAGIPTSKTKTGNHEFAYYI